MNNMKAIVYRKYGPPDVARLSTLPRPVPRDNQVLIRVKATTVNRTDSGFRSAEYFVSRFWSGLIRPKYPVLGCEFAGEVIATGSKVKQFKAGDRVFGYNDKSFGGHAEYIAVDETSALALVPASLDYDTAAPLTEGAHYALNNIRAAKVSPGQQVLVYGATGAIGTAAVQLLKHFGARVTAVCNTKNVALVEQLGADVVIDYLREDFTQTGEQYHFIFDAVGKSSFTACRPLLTPQGIYISTELGKRGANIFYALTTARSKGQRVLFPIPVIDQQDVLLLQELAKQGAFTPVIDRYYNLEEIVEAYRYVETGQKTGNVVIKVA
ncbi:NADPH:quinone reductase-like Zn-dependent oxidoreductase [Taibaiella chishuiensis]|uniref:NADPH:quinone reductase-like Zn-dependent oxidoreductase n=2 Tax=Taibaiella chishuiensis TaxID=1434707 RepID=A0A2P8D2T9_9BACT|nr:NADPH:quinone reductase-like Zn-dependent oxidoreductase [Taibaiella chishuiensis]